MKYILPSNRRLSALTKYLVQLSISFGPRDLNKRVDTTKPLDGNEGLGKIINGRVQQPPEPAFKRLHILYIIHDVLSRLYTDYDFDDPERSALIEDLQPRVCTLAELAACHCCEKGTKTTPMVMDLVELWATRGIFTPEQITQTRDNILLADGSEWRSLESNLRRQDGGNRADKQRREHMMKYAGCLPARHGVIDNPDAPWHELPAANAFSVIRDIGFPTKEWYLDPGGERVEGGRK